MTDKAPRDEVELFRRVSKDGDHAPHGFQHIHNDEPLFKKPTLLCCGGMMTNLQNPDGKKNCNGYAKIGHGLLCYPESFAASKQASYRPDIDIVSVCYPLTESQLMREHHGYMQRLKENAPAQPSVHAEKFAQRYLFPLVQNEAGGALPLPEVMRNLRNIQVLAHSYGKTFIQEVGDTLVARMEKLGFSAEDIRKSTSQILVVSAGSITPPATGRASFTTVDILNANDTEIRNSYDIDSSLKDLLLKENLLVDRKNQPVPPSARIDHRNYYEYYPAKPLNIMPVETSVRMGQFEFSRHEQGNQWLAYASQPIVINGLGDIIQLPAIPTLERSNERGIFDNQQPLSTDHTHHQVTTYFSNKRPESGVSKGISDHTEHASTLRTMMSSLLINSMSNAVTNAHADTFTPLAQANELMQLPGRTEYITSLDVPLRHVAKIDRYDEKLAKGLDTQRPARIGIEY